MVAWLPCYSLTLRLPLPPVQSLSSPVEPPAANAVGEAWLGGGGGGRGHYATRRAAAILRCSWQLITLIVLATSLTRFCHTTTTTLHTKC